MDWKQDAERLRFDEGLSWTEIANRLKGCFEDATFDQVKERIRSHVRRYCNRYKENQPQRQAEDLMKVLRRGATIYEIQERCQLSDREATDAIHNLAVRGYVVNNVCGTLKISNTFPICEPNVTKKRWNGEKIVRFGLMGDTQINSLYTQLTYLHELYDFYAEEGITDVYHTGDIDEGDNMRPGHRFECYTQGADQHVAEIVKVYPKRAGMTTHFITGNHDHAFMKHAGLDIGVMIARDREDMKYLGLDSAVIWLTPECSLELRHPGDATSYAISYKTQKMIDAMSGGEKPHILGIGHYHKQEYIFYRNIHAFQTGCVQAQTPWMKGKGIAAFMGGWIVEVHVHDDGTIGRIKHEFLPFYKAIKDDYLNWR